MSSARLDKKICVVTGAGGRIGKAIVDYFIAQGAVVVPVDIVAIDQPNSVICDQSDLESVRKLEQSLAEKYGSVDVLVNNGALGGHRCPTHEKTIEEYDDVMRVNARGPFLLTQLAIRLHLEKKDDRSSLSIVNIASMAGNIATPQAVVYSMSKFALIGLTRTVAAEYAKQGVRCNSVSPGVMEVPNIQGFDAQSFNGMLAQTPMGRGGTPMEVASLVAYLASDEAAFITGADFKIDGGRMA